MSQEPQPSSPTKVTVIEEGSEFKGTLTSSCPIEVRGRIEGELNTPALTVGASGAVHGRAKVGAVRSHGELAGEFEADSIELAGVVRDNTVIRARTLDVKLASKTGKLQVIFGECEAPAVEQPADARPVEATQAAPAEPSVEAAAVAPSAGDAEAEEAGDDAEAGPRGRRARRRKNGDGEGQHWSQPPSQPPPAS